MSTRVTEYYDCFDVKTVLTYTDVAPTITAAQNTALPDTDNTFLNETNGFRGFNNFAQDDAINGLLSSVHNQGSAFTPPSTSATINGVPLASDLITITGKHKAPQAINNISIDDAGNILCYPPNISVPYWNRVIFKHFDYDINPATDYNGPYKTVIESYLNKFEGDYTSAKLKIYDYRNVPVFVKYDMYPSRTKVVYSSADKWNQNSSDIVHNFNYHHGQMEPIKLNISLSASNPITDPDNSKNRYNQQLTYDDIQKLFKKCYWSIEWIYDRASGN